MDKQHLDLMQFFEGYVRNYRSLNLSNDHNRSMFTKREINYFCQMGEMLGFEAFIEDSKFDQSIARSRPMDLAWWKWDAREDNENFLYLALHLERENTCTKDIETIEKLFSDTYEDYIPHNVIGIQHIESKERMKVLNELVIQKNIKQKSNVLMVYRYPEQNYTEGVSACFFDANNSYHKRNAICRVDNMDIWYMGFEEEFKEEQEFFANLDSLIKEYKNEVEEACKEGLLTESTANTYLLHTSNFYKWCKGDFTPGKRNRQRE